MSGWWAVFVGVLLALPILLIAADFSLLAVRSLTAQVRYREYVELSVAGLVRQAWYLTLYKWRRSPRIRLQGLRADVDALYEGQMIAAVATWWNAFLERRPAFQRLAGARPLNAADVASLNALLARDNREPLVAKARAIAPFDTLAEASFALAYSFARVFAAGSDTEAPIAPQPITVDHLAAIDRNYGVPANLLISDLANVPAEGWWKEIELMGLWNQLTVDAIRRAYLDQVRRWEKAEGRVMGSGIGFSIPESGQLVDTFTDLLFEHGGRFFETERTVAALLEETT